MLLKVPLDFDFVWTGRLGPRVQGGLQALRHKALPDPFDAAQAGTQGLYDLVVSILSLIGSIPTVSSSFTSVGLTQPLGVSIASNEYPISACHGEEAKR